MHDLHHDPRIFYVPLPVQAWLYAGLVDFYGPSLHHSSERAQPFGSPPFSGLSSFWFSIPVLPFFFPLLAVEPRDITVVCRLLCFRVRCCEAVILFFEFLHNDLRGGVRYDIRSWYRRTGRETKRVGETEWRTFPRIRIRGDRLF